MKLNRIHVELRLWWSQSRKHYIWSFFRRTWESVELDPRLDEVFKLSALSVHVSLGGWNTKFPSGCFNLTEIKQSPQKLNYPFIILVFSKFSCHLVVKHLNAGEGDETFSRPGFTNCRRRHSERRHIVTAPEQQFYGQFQLLRRHTEEMEMMVVT